MKAYIKLVNPYRHVYIDSNLILLIRVNYGINNPKVINTIFDFIIHF